VYVGLTRVKYNRRLSLDVKEKVIARIKPSNFRAPHVDENRVLNREKLLVQCYP
jgi:hypothetical protein